MQQSQCVPHRQHTDWYTDCYQNAERRITLRDRILILSTPQTFVSFINHEDRADVVSHATSVNASDVIQQTRRSGDENLRRPPRVHCSRINSYIRRNAVCPPGSKPAVITGLQQSPRMSSELSPSPPDDLLAPSKLDQRARQSNTHDFGLIPIPHGLRYDESSPPEFGIGLNLLFALASTFLVANVYYCQPILVDMSKSFDVTYSQISSVPTMAQAGYAVGLFLLSPLGDIIRPRPLILSLVTLSTLFTVGLCFAPSMSAFAGLSFLTCMASIAPQLLLPLAADLAPAHRRGTAIALCISGLLFGVLLARVLAGLIAQFAHWRYTFYFAMGAQVVVGAALAAMLPDFPARNTRLTYFGVLRSMGRFILTEPVLAQAALVNFSSIVCFANFWVTLTFLLSAAPFSFTTLQIGLFGLLATLGVLVGPFVGRVTDVMHPWKAALLGTIGYAASQGIQLGAGGIHLAAVAIACIGLDVFRQLQQVSLTRAALELDPSARGRLNTVVILSIFLGQVVGTRLGTKIFLDYGWRVNAAFAMGFMGLQFVFLFLRGPNVSRYTWIGWEGGWTCSKQATPSTPPDVEKALDESMLSDVATHTLPRPKAAHITDHT